MLRLLGWREGVKKRLTGRQQNKKATVIIWGTDFDSHGDDGCIFFYKWAYFFVEIYRKLFFLNFLLEKKEKGGKKM
jgi:hypothetical protein